MPLSGRILPGRFGCDGGASVMMMMVARAAWLLGLWRAGIAIDGPITARGV